MANMQFSGGDNFTGIEQKIHEVLMQTELRDGMGAYEVSFAGGNSGISFGANQMDIAHNSGGYTVFKDIMENSGMLTKAEADIVANKERTDETGKTPQQVFGNLLPKVNQALASPYGVSKINEAYQNDVAKLVSVVKDRVGSLSNGYNRAAILGNEEMLVWLMDYHNQFYIQPSGKMINFLNGEAITFETDGDSYRSTIRMRMPGLPTVDDLIAFIRSTFYYRSNKSSARSQENRIKKIADYFGREISKHEAGSHMLNDIVRETEFGDPKACTLTGKCDKYPRTISFQIDKSKMKNLSAHILFDDHAWVTLNGKVIFESVKAISACTVEERNGQRYIVTADGSFLAETNRIDSKVVDLTEMVRDGVNTILYTVVVEDGGTSFIKLTYSGL